MSLWISDYRSLIDFFSMVIMGSPDAYPRPTFLKDHQQLTLDSAFDELRQGLHFATERIADKAIVAEIHARLEKAYDLYRSGQAREGHDLMLEFEKLVLTSVRRPRRS